MCRLAAYFGPEASPGDLLFAGNHSLASQAWAPRELLHGTINADGWGVAWDTPDGLVRLARAEPIWFDPDARPLLASIRSRAALAVLRNATPGLPVDRSGMLPMVRSGWAFAMNGFVPAFRRDHMRGLRALLSDEGYGALTGVSDAETLFLLTLDAMAAGAAPLEALTEVRARVSERLTSIQDSPLTLVLMGRSGVFALNSSAGGPVNSLYLGADTAPMSEGLTLASECLDAGEWQPVPAHCGVSMTTEGCRVVPLPG